MHALAVSLTLLMPSSSSTISAISCMKGMGSIHPHRERAPIEDSMFMERIRSTMASATKEEALKSHHQPSHQRPAGHPVLRLQRIVGNRAVQRLLCGGGLQGKFKVSKSNDKFEQRDRAMAGTATLAADEDGSATRSADGQPRIQSTRARPVAEEARRQFKLVASSLALLRISASKRLIIARAVFYEGFNIHRDIDLFDPTTAPAGRPLGLGHTEMVANGLPIQGEGIAPRDKLDLLFPLPNYTKSYSVSGAECIKSESEGSLNIASNIRVLQNPPWAAIVPHGELVKILGGRLAKEPGCSTGNVDVTFTAGDFDDAGFQQWLINAEMQHASDQECLVKKYLKGYENDVNALPSTIPAG